MLTIKPGSSQLQEPDPAFQQIDPANIIFVTDEPKNQSNDKDNDEVQPYQMAKKTQGSESGNTDDERAATEALSNKTQYDAHDETDTPEKDTHLDTANKALTDEHKKGLKDLTTVDDQSLADDSVQEKVSATQAHKEIKTPEQAPVTSEVVVENFDDKVELKENIESAEKHQQMFDAIEQFNRLMQERQVEPNQQPEKIAVVPSKNISVEPAQKIESKKHRPIEVGPENQSKLELTKDVSEYQAPKKRKLSLQDLNLGQGFSDFVRKGNADFSSDGNSDHDDDMGMKYSSYLTQISTMITNAFNMFPELYTLQPDHMPMQNSRINLIIERSGKVTLIAVQSSGEPSYDAHHMKIIKFMGDCPPIPKFIKEEPFVYGCICLCPKNRSFGSFRPEKLQNIF